MEVNGIFKSEPRWDASGKTKATENDAESELFEFYSLENIILLQKR